MKERKIAKIFHIVEIEATQNAMTKERKAVGIS